MVSRNCTARGRQGAWTRGHMAGTWEGMGGSQTRWFVDAGYSMPVLHWVCARVVTLCGDRLFAARGRRQSCAAPPSNVQHDSNVQHP
eukprot:4603333-Prymnesium_polylepis.1